jgi:hypothetical protein
MLSPPDLPEPGVVSKTPLQAHPHPVLMSLLSNGVTTLRAPHHHRRDVRTP